MIRKTEDLLKEVRMCMDSNIESTPLIVEGDESALSLDEIIRSKLIDAVTMVESSAPFYMIEKGHNLEGSVYWGDNGRGWVLLPDDFMRLLVFEMSDWGKPVNELMEQSDPRYSILRSRFKGIGGTAERPVCVLSTRPEGKAIEFYSCKSEDARLSKGVYLPYPYIDKDGGIDLSERCCPSIIYMAAALSYSSIGEADKAAIMAEQSKNLLK